MKYLIVNADDFGASRGINRGILEAHHRGILTSTSLMVDSSSAEHAAALSRTAPRLSVGLHADLSNELRESTAATPRQIAEALRKQLGSFQELMGRLPTHLDSHHNLHRDPRALPAFLELARRNRLPLREHSQVRYFSKFYGQWDGETHLEQISVESLTRMLEREIEDGITELSCHPGYIDAEYPTGYSSEREAELRALCDPGIRKALVDQSIRLISYQDLSGIQANRPR